MRLSLNRFCIFVISAEKSISQGMIFIGSLKGNDVSLFSDALDLGLGETITSVSETKRRGVRLELEFEIDGPRSSSTGRKPSSKTRTFTMSLPNTRLKHWPGNTIEIWPRRSPSSNSCANISNNSQSDIDRGSICIDAALNTDVSTVTLTKVP